MSLKRFSRRNFSRQRFLQWGYVSFPRLRRFCRACRPLDFSIIGGAQPGTGCSGYPAERACAHLGGRGVGQDPRPDHPYCVVVTDGTDHPGRRACGHLYQQGCQGDDGSPECHVACERTRDVDRDVSRVVQPLSACPLSVGGPTVDFSDFGHARPALGDKTAVQAIQN